MSIFSSRNKIITSLETKLVLHYLFNTMTTWWVPGRISRVLFSPSVYLGTQLNGAVKCTHTGPPPFLLMLSCASSIYAHMYLGRRGQTDIGVPGTHLLLACGGRKPSGRAWGSVTLLSGSDVITLAMSPRTLWFETKILWQISPQIIEFCPQTRGFLHATSMSGA